MKKSAVMLAALMLCLFAGGCDSGGVSSTPAADSSNTSVVQQVSSPVSAAASDSADISKPPVSSDIQVSSAQAPESLASVDGIDEKYLSGMGDIDGIILEIHANGFAFVGGVPKLSADGEVATLAAELEMDVVYTADTVFLLTEYTRATDESTVRMASADDVAAWRGVAVWGSFENEKFVAEVVRVLVPA